GRRHPLTRDLEHVVATALVREVAVSVEVVLVAGDSPLTAERRLRLLVLVPVVGATGVAADPEMAGLSSGQLGPRVVDDLRLVPGDDLPARATPRAAGQ